MKGERRTAPRFSFSSALAALLTTILWAGAAHAGTPAQLSVVGGTGVPGSTVAVTINLANDTANAGVSADLDIAFPTDQVEFFPPVTTNCQVAARLQSTHQVGGTVPQPGLLRFSIFDPTGLDPLGDGELASCDFHILPGVPAGSAALTVQFAELTGANGDIPVDAVDGAIQITTEGPTLTPTSTPTSQATATFTTSIGVPTNTATPTGTTAATVTATATSPVTGGTATATSTSGTPVSTNTATATGGTQIGTPTATPTGGTPGGTPTHTRIPTFRPSNEDDGCSVGSGQHSSAGATVLLLVPALLLWARRRRF